MPTELRIPEEYEERELNLAVLWAQAEGCEGGDYLIGLCEMVRQATPGHGYCYGADRLHRDVLLGLVRDQVDAMRKEATGPEPSEGWDQEEIAAIVALEEDGQ